MGWWEIAKGIKGGLDDFAENSSKRNPICPDCPDYRMGYITEDVFQCRNCGRILNLNEPEAGSQTNQPLVNSGGDDRLGDRSRAGGQPKQYSSLYGCPQCGGSHVYSDGENLMKCDDCGHVFDTHGPEASAAMKASRE